MTIHNVFENCVPLFSFHKKQFSFMEYFTEIESSIGDSNCSYGVLSIDSFENNEYHIYKRHFMILEILENNFYNVDLNNYIKI